MGQLSLHYEALSVEASKQTTAEEIVACIVERLNLTVNNNILCIFILYEEKKQLVYLCCRITICKISVNDTRIDYSRQSSLIFIFSDEKNCVFSLYILIKYICIGIEL